LTRKIVISLNTSWNIYNFRLNLAKSLKDSGYEVIFVAPYDQYSEKLKQEFEYHDLYINNKGTHPKQDLKTLIEFYKLYQKIKPDIVLSYTIKPIIYGNIACRFLGIKTINNISGLGTVFIKQGLITKIVKLLYRYSLQKSSKVFFQNSDDRDLFVENRLVKLNKCDLLPGSGIDINKFTPVSTQKKDGTFIFLLIARMLWDKGVGEYVEAAKIIKQIYPYVTFQLLGSLDAVNKTAITQEQMRSWTDDGLVEYLGLTDDVKMFISDADCIVLPSYREGTPRSLLESASMAKPIITTNVPGCREVVDNGINGYLCNVKDPEDLAHKMEKMLNLSPQEKMKMGTEGRQKIVREFDEKIVISKYLNAIKEIL